jgi:two-component system LytT family sensor kinase
LNASSTDRRTTWRFAPLWFALFLWGGLLTLFTVTAAIANLERWTVALTHAFSFWCLWMFFFPMIVWLSMRFPLERPKIFSQIVFHVFACLLVVVLNQAAYRTFLLSPPRAGMVQPAQVPPRSRSTDMRAIPDILMYLVTMSGCVAFAHFRKAQERERRAIELEAHLAQAKLQALRMQINPHFLFNTLNAISTLVHTSPHTADEMITDLSELFRASLESSDDQEITLARELELLRRYLAIEQHRFGPRLQVDQNIDPEILNAFVPTLILQPIVENAIRHGIEPQADTGRIAIQARRDGEQIKLSVSDNGKKAFDASIMERKRNGIGLANTRARLQQLYGKEQSFSVGNSTLGGWMVEIKIPFCPAPIAKPVS